MWQFSPQNMCPKKLNNPLTSIYREKRSSYHQLPLYFAHLSTHEILTIKLVIILKLTLFFFTLNITEISFRVLPTQIFTMLNLISYISTMSWDNLIKSIANFQLLYTDLKLQMSEINRYPLVYHILIYLYFFLALKSWQESRLITKLWRFDKNLRVANRTNNSLKS